VVGLFAQGEKRGKNSPTNERGKERYNSLEEDERETVKDYYSVKENRPREKKKKKFD